LIHLKFTLPTAGLEKEGTEHFPVHLKTTTPEVFLKQGNISFGLAPVAFIDNHVKSRLSSSEGSSAAFPYTIFLPTGRITGLFCC